MTLISHTCVVFFVCGLSFSFPLRLCSAKKELSRKRFSREPKPCVKANLSSLLRASAKRLPCVPILPKRTSISGLAELQQGHLDPAIRSLSRCLELKPRLRGANLFLGIAHYRKNEYTSAVAALQREIKIDPQNGSVFMWLGLAQLGTGETVKASESLDRAAALKPDDIDILYHRGRAHMLISKESYERMYKAPQFVACSSGFGAILR